MDTVTRRPRSGPRTFEREQALDAAMRLFWQQGYEGTSISELTRAMGIRPPSLYAAFGSKAALYRETLERYGALPGALTGAAGARDLEEALQGIMRAAADAVTDPAGISGCMISLGLLVHGPEAADVAADVAGRRQNMLRQIEGIAMEWLDGAASRRVASLVLTVIQGMAVRSIDGAGRTELRRIAREAATMVATSVQRTPRRAGGQREAEAGE